jgi:YD repeat-containing protein
MDAKGQTSTTQFDNLGRAVRETLPEGAITYVYDSAANGIGKLASVTSYNGFRRLHSYDGLSRPDTVTTVVGSESFNVRSQYDALGRLERLNYPTGFAVRQVYNERGYLAELRKDSDNSLLWRSERVSAEGQMQRQLLGNGVATTREYDATHGWVTEIRSGLGNGTEVQNLSFGFEPVGNLQSRSDNRRGLLELFGYDNLNRLTSAEIPGREGKSYSYDSLGNITFKSDVGSYAYDRIAAGPHAVTKAGNMLGRYSYDANGNMTGGNGRSFSYFSFNKPRSIENAAARSEFTYDSEHNRLTHTSVVGGVTNSTLYVGGLYERTVAPTGIQHRHFIAAGNSLVAIHKLSVRSFQVLSRQCSPLHRSAFRPHPPASSSGGLRGAL